MKLDSIRAKINKIDTQLVGLISKRQSLMPAVGKYKKENKLPLTDLAREKEILESKKKIAKQLKLNPIFIEKIFKLLFKEGKKVQKKVM